MNAEELKQFEREIADLFEARQIHCPIHLSSGNEDQLIEIFKNIKPNDYVFSTHRNHYHYLLHTGNGERLKNQILNGDSMHTSDPEHNFYSSSIVAGCVAIACGVALALKMKKSNQKVFIFCGDGATDEGCFIEALRYAVVWDLPTTFIIEDNDRSVEATKNQRWAEKVLRYRYDCEYPHVGIGKWVTL